MSVQIVKTKKGYYVYSRPTKIGRRRRLTGPLPTYKQAQRVKRKMTKTRRKRKK